MSQVPVFKPEQNLLLSLLPPAVHGRLAHRLTPIRLEMGEVVIEAGDVINAVYFPVDAVLSLDQRITDTAIDAEVSASVALAGSEGVVGFEVLLGGQTAINRATARLAGSALQINADVLREEFSRGAAMQRVLLRATDALVAQIAATAVCERLHDTAQRLTRWMLLAHDRARQHELMLTQETLSHLLGVRRESVSSAASQLQRSGLILYRRGNLLIIDRSGLEARACKCYREIKARYDGLLELAE